MSTLKYTSGDPKPAVIFSGGQEIVSLAILEELASYNVPLIVFALGRHSFLRGLQPVKGYCRLDWPPVSVETTLNQIITFLHNLGAAAQDRWPVYATEDTSLRFVIENRTRLDEFLCISNSSLLDSGGLDKAELFTYLNKNQEIANCIAPTAVLEHPEDFILARERIGADLVVKPALKPLSGDLNIEGGAKIFIPSPNESERDVLNTLRRAWPISTKWIAQKRLKYHPKGEPVWWGVRLESGDTIGATAVDYRFYPQNGGTAFWVGMEKIDGIEDAAVNILEAAGLTGIFEVEFLLDDDQAWKMIEINPRPWLQVALSARAGLPLVYYDYCDRLNLDLPTVRAAKQNTTWVNVERLFLSAFSKDYASRRKDLAGALRILRKADCVAVYDSPFHLVKIRYLSRMVRALFNKIF